ncbi:hypothetical protein SADUNF_Sadunf16G0273300 [Salix dunnii]|uniref:Serine-threonine/tyrosine-protein kinase catalytic domain-containing protein n=1 Tax=Salix dunnii TaxID=1413687 RepID=A0A835JCH5_9ROSI|nr:hypothetical protein SADUNF_Sadunf16G0273300 [Salix dunnii]
MSPEYAIDGVFSIKSNVFSFGVLLLEIVSGKRNRGSTHPEHELNLLEHARNYLFLLGQSMCVYYVGNTLQKIGHACEWFICWKEMGHCLSLKSHVFSQRESKLIEENKKDIFPSME